MQTFVSIPFPCRAETTRRRPYKSPTCSAAAEEPKTRLRARVAYEGSRYSGWQFQPNALTVQGELEAALSRRSGALVRVVGASRTDAGVHARGQGVHFDVPGSPDLRGLQFSVNQMLPPDIRMRDVCVAPEGEKHAWHAIFRAQGKRYSYRFSTRKVYDPLQNSFRMYEYRAAQGRFCERRLREAADRFVGTRDFTAFANSVPTLPNGLKVSPIRTVRSIDILREEDGHIRLDFDIDGALYKMIRNVTGTLLDVACGKMEVEDIPRLFESRDRKLVSKSAPARGLCLEEVFYDDWEASSVGSADAEHP